MVFGGGLLYLSRGLEAGLNVKINGIDQSALNDGVYTGKYEFGRWSNEVKVVVENYKITAIEIVDDVTFPLPSMAKELFNRVIQAQNTTVDAVTEATVTSKAYLKAIENALNKPQSP